MAIACVSDFRREAEKRLPRFLFDYIDGGAYSEVTLRRNVADLADIALRQRVLVDVSKIDLTTRLFGCDLALPFGLGPVGMSGMYARRGEAQAARAAATKGIPICLSSVSVCDLREVAAAGANPLWFQLYVIRDRAYMAELPKNKENQAKIRELCNESQHQGKLTVAEFVEDAASMSILFSCGVNFVQGNFLQEPEKVMALEAS